MVTSARPDQSKTFHMKRWEILSDAMHHIIMGILERADTILN